MAKQRSNKQKAKNHDIKNLGLTVTTVIDGAIHNPEVLATSRPPILSNPLGYTDELTKLSPFWGNVALRVLCASIGYYADNTLLWNYRKRNMQPTVTSSIDWMNDSINEMREKIESERVLEEQGLNRVPFVDGTQLVGAYKYLFSLVCSSPDIPSMNMPTPAHLYRQMQRQRDGTIALEAYEKFENEAIRSSKNFAYLAERIKENNAKESIRLKNKMQQEIDQIHTELQAVQTEDLTDSVWDRIPLWAQFRLIRSVHKQVISALVNEEQLPPEERVHKAQLLELANTVLLELEAADREPDVRRAFDTQVLKDQHRLITTQ
jgi:hypothetical protein